MDNREQEGEDGLPGTRGWAIGYKKVKVEYWGGEGGGRDPGHRGVCWLHISMFHRSL